MKTNDDIAGAFDEIADLLEVVGSVHSRFDLPRDKQTDRILRAMDNPCFSILGHPSGRLLLKRKAIDVDMGGIIQHAEKRGCFPELNSQPQRLDLDEYHCRQAREAGVLISINSDAHAGQNFDYLEFGIKQARRGWLEKKDVLNTRSLKSLRKLLRQTMT